ncbi:malto-oligosyltrehalose synthase [Ancylobacter terrae]|uniref:malto-oligosyltrehalose synthase n=1 Tax=Ancylobacter sp. sgz301288 TaxID=3342077 RepID=UPI00385A6603
MTAPAPLPPLLATYRLQFHKGFTFADAERLVPYLAGLGISHLYASPITTAVPGSTHGYDVADPTRINPELGGEEEFLSLGRALAAHGMGLLLDIVPNHMAASSHNPFWMAMLEEGPDSAAARLFDVKWDSGRLLLPVLGDPLQATLAAGGVSLRADPAAGRILAVYADHAFPLRAESVAALLDALPGDDRTDRTDRSRSDSSSTSPHSLVTARERLRQLDPAQRAALDDALAKADIAAVLAAQHWRLAWWRTAAHDLNYRRFFNITDLAGVRVEDDEVFDIVHRLPFDLVRRGLVHGLRIDHIDGLVDPASYCQRLRNCVGPDVPILVEKILEPGETLRPWPIDGTTGYERLNHINGLFVDPEGHARLEAALRERHILVGSLPERLATAKRQVLETSLRAEVELLAGLARDGLDEAMAAGDLTDTAVRDGVVALLTHCPVYRSYATNDSHDAGDVAIWQAIRSAVAANENPLTAAAASLLLERVEHPLTASDREFRLRFQQVSGPAMAKGFEDTELYRHPVLLCANEVGGSLEHPSRTPAQMHALATARAQAGARDLIPLATHDTKRGPATRARLVALGGRAELWLDFLDEVDPLCRRFTHEVDGAVMPDALDRHFILQTLFSAWPISAERMQVYLTKALREAKRHTDWETPSETYEAASLGFARALIEAPESADFRQRLDSLCESLAPAAQIVRLGQLVLQHTLPGTPDLYQGTELPDFSLVDPDNRRPVDWEARIKALAATGALAREDAEHLALTRDLLALRRRNAALREGDYRPVDVAPSPWQWFGFERRRGETAVLVLLPTRVPEGAQENARATVDLAAPLAKGWRTHDGEALPGGAKRLEFPAGRPLLVAEKA